MYVGLMLFEDLPYSLTVMGLISVGFYSLLLRNFPFIELLSPTFIVSCGKCLCLVSVGHGQKIINHRGLGDCDPQIINKVSYTKFILINP